MPILLAVQISEQYCGREIASIIVFLHGSHKTRSLHFELRDIRPRHLSQPNILIFHICPPAHLNMTLPREDIEFKAVDGTILRGWFYPTNDESPCIIMSHGVSFASPSPRMLLTDQVC
jgi:hypothetical protein